MKRTVFVEIHDVSPAAAHVIDSIVDRLPQAIASLASMLVVPNWGGRWPLAAHRTFVDRLRAHPGAKVLHGTTHTLGASFWDRAYYGTDNESEFAKLDEEAAASRLQDGQHAFADAFGEAPRWFCAPRWQMSAGARRALAAAGIPGVLTREHIAWHGRVVAHAPAVWFDDGTRRAVRAVARRLRKRRVRMLVSAGGPLRLTLHPRDMEDRSAAGEIAALVDSLGASGWTARPLSDFVS
jgi:predicted deacetylase